MTAFSNLDEIHTETPGNVISTVLEKLEEYSEIRLR